MLEPVDPNELLSLRQVRVTRSPDFTDLRLAAALPSTGRVTESWALLLEDVLPEPEAEDEA
jgi:hypothetical protein